MEASFDQFCTVFKETQESTKRRVLSLCNFFPEILESGNFATAYRSSNVLST